MRSVLFKSSGFTTGRVYPSVDKCVATSNHFTCLSVYREDGCAVNRSDRDSESSHKEPHRAFLLLIDQHDTSAAANGTLLEAFDAVAWSKVDLVSQRVGMASLDQLWLPAPCRCRTGVHTGPIPQA